MEVGQAASPAETFVDVEVIVPCFNEQDCLVTCHERLSAILRQTQLQFRILYVDDGSKDSTPDLLRQLFTSDPEHVVVLSLSRNFGHQPAVTAGMLASRASAVVIIDADLQDPPELIPEMIALWQTGYQVVYGVRQSRTGESHFKLFTAKMFYRLINSLAEVEIPLDAGDFRLLDRVVIDAFRQMPERQRLLRGMSSWIGYKQVGVLYHRDRRFAGETKYPLRRMLVLAIDGIVSFSIVPLRFVSILGLGAALIAFLGIAYTLFVRVFTHSWVRGWAISFIGMLLMSGVQMLCIGVLGEYIGRIYTETKQRPLYLLREELRQTNLNQG